jgi:hypothetical protein
MYRMFYEQIRLNGMGGRPQVPATSASAHDLALKMVREHEPDFEPQFG